MSAQLACTYCLCAVCVERRFSWRAGSLQPYDTAWSHYIVQQTLYAFMLRSKSGIQVQRMLMVQCHPHVCGSDFNEAPLTPDFELADAMAKALMRESVPQFQHPKG